MTRPEPTPGLPESDSGVGVMPEESAASPVPQVVPGTPAAGTVAGPGMGREALYFALRNKKLIGGLVIILIFLVAAVVGPNLIGGNPNAYVGPPFHRPDGDFWFGTTTFGQDVFSQFIHGLRASFYVGVLGGGVAAIAGMMVGFTAGFRGGLIDEILNMLTNVVLVLPALAVLIIVNAYLGVRSLTAEALFIGLTTWPWAARAIRAQTFSLRVRDFVDLARLSGVRGGKIVFKEIAPNMSSYLLLTFILLFGNAVLIGATLDFIGLGPTNGVSLGLMMNNAVQWSALKLGMWWWFVPPGAGITVIVGSLYVMNVGLDEVFNPKLREM